MSVEREGGQGRERKRGREKERLLADRPENLICDVGTMSAKHGVEF